MITETGALAGSPTLGCAPPTQAIKAVAEGPEPDFLRRRAVIVRHQGPPQSNGTRKEYRFPDTSPDLSLLRRNTGVPPVAAVLVGSLKSRGLLARTSRTMTSSAEEIAHV